MRTILLCVVAAMAIAIVGCAPPTPLPNLAPPPTNVSAPLNLCTPAIPPKEVAAQAGYVQYVVSVTDAAGNPVRDLKQSDFEAHVGNQSLPIKYFRDDKGEAPQSIVVVVDESGSMMNKLVVRDQGRLQRVRQDIGETAGHLNKCDEVAEIAVGGRPANETESEDGKIRIIQPLTTDHALALSRITEQVPYGQTPLYDGLTQGLQLIESAHYPNRILIIITDGLDNTSEAKLDEVLDRAKKDSVPIYAIGIGDPNLAAVGISISTGPFVMGADDSDRLDANSLKALSVPSGGQYYVVSELEKDNASGLVAAIGKVADALGHSYAIGVIGPTAGVSEEQTITIGLANADARRVNARLESTSAATSR